MVNTMKLTCKYQVNKRGRNNKSNSYVIYSLNGIEILKQKLPYDEDYEMGFQHTTVIADVYLLNGRIYQTRNDGNRVRNVSFPVSRNKLKQLEIPNDLKINVD